ncbi:hypothetical protein BDN70DRAFT_901317 [Pholiota conissans]|uniref:Uncharacterized protein n=1 Tax=Pholiota conissans TaxID=109636 RepID=A0A9P6CM89_9AGAR|nr:hypothetical protein BDN70DRAFT_901317 [Pholiota conissans]
MEAFPRRHERPNLSEPFHHILLCSLVRGISDLFGNWNDYACPRLFLFVSSFVSSMTGMCIKIHFVKHYLPLTPHSHNPPGNKYSRPSRFLLRISRQSSNVGTQMMAKNFPAVRFTFVRASRARRKSGFILMAIVCSPLVGDTEFWGWFLCSLHQPDLVSGVTRFCTMWLDPLATYDCVVSIPTCVNISSSLRKQLNGYLAFSVCCVWWKETFSASFSLVLNFAPSEIVLTKLASLRLGIRASTSNMDIPRPGRIYPLRRQWYL